jgi:hypothetical protein
METELDFQDFEDNVDILVEIKEKKRKKKMEDEKFFKSTINKKKLSKYELDELFLD